MTDVTGRTMTSISLKMALRRWSFNCKLKTRVAFLSLLLIFITISLLYRSLASEDGHNSDNQKYFPTLIKKRPIRFHSKHFLGDNPLQSHVDNLMNGQKNYFSHFKDRDILNADSREALMRFLARLYPDHWATAAETDDMALELKYLLLDYGFESKMTCKEIDNLRLGHAITFTRSKFIEFGYTDSSDNDYNKNYYFAFNGGQNSNSNQGRRQESDMAVKSPSNDIDTKIQCMKQIYDAEYCSTMGNYRFLREVLLMTVLHHPSIPVLKGYCMRGKTISSTLQLKGLIMVTEVGSPLSQSLVYASTMRQRLSYALQIASLLLYLENSPVGSLRLSKFQLKDFALVDGTTVKLVDLDDLVLGELPCSSSQDCVLPESRKGVECSSGECEGFNSISNLDLVSKQALLVLLHDRLANEKTHALVESLQTLEIDTAELVSQLHIILMETPEDPPPKIVRPPALDEGLGWRAHLESNQRQDSAGDNDVGVVKMARGTAPQNLGDSDEPALLHFTRFDLRNFPGMYDYPCTGSRVSWGCVFTVTSLTQAANLCDKDLNCKSFVIFATKPESETLMTVLLKNAFDNNPQTSSGTTLFVKTANGGLSAWNGDQSQEARKKMEVAPAEKDNLDEDEDDDDDLDEEEDREMVAVHECQERTAQTYESARFSREKRLMTHLGLKGIREQSWRRSALEQRFGNFSTIVKSGGGGGKFQVSLEKRQGSVLPPVAFKATFMAEEGPSAYHLAYALVYHLDRLLGFYHTPPCVGKKLTASELQPFHMSPSWEETFQPLIESDGALIGILMPSVPRVMKLNKVTLQPLGAMVSEVIRFERPNKLQLEYMLLSWLAGMSLASNEHLGYKGHLIHFNADHAFKNTSINFSEYLHHCQFPNVAYKSLLCFRCKNDAYGITICHLGEEASSRLRAMFEDEVILGFYRLTEQKVMESINLVASHIMLKVDQCIKKFGRESVLY